MNKKGQDGKGVAILLLLIALFMVLYILLLPPEQRDYLLNDTIGGSTKGEDFNPKIVLIENPGYVNPNKESSVRHDLSSINLFIKSEPTSKKLADNLEISKSIINNKPYVLTFDVDDKSNLKDMILFFSVEDSKGNLIVRLNNNIIYDGKTKSAETIKLPINFIKEDNTLEIRSSSPGLFFWRKNFYILNNIGIKETYQLTNPKEERIFSIPKYEITSLSNAKLIYQYYCSDLEKDLTTLKIFLNEKNILDKLTGCSGGSESVEIDKTYFKEGNNQIEFVIGEGDFQFSNVYIESELKEKVYPVYHFEIDEDDFDFLQSGDAEARLRISMNEDIRKRVSILINNKEINVDTNENEFSREITSYVENGDNILRIIPQNTFYLDELEIKLLES